MVNQLSIAIFAVFGSLATTVFAFDSSSSFHVPSSWTHPNSDSSVEIFGMPSKHVALEFVSTNSLFSDSYFVSQVSNTDSIALVSRRDCKKKLKNEIREYLEGLGIGIGELEQATRLLVRYDNAVVEWINKINKMDIPEFHKLRLAKAADELRLEQLKLEARLYQLKARYYFDIGFRSEIVGEDNRLVRKTLSEYETRLDRITQKGGL